MEELSYGRVKYTWPWTVIVYKTSKCGKLLGQCFRSGEDSEGPEGKKSWKGMT